MPASVRDAFEALIDYAGLFPPARLGMAEAVTEYAQERQAPMHWMLGRFIVAASRIGELLSALPPGEPFALSAILDADQDPRRWFASMQLTVRALSDLPAREARVRVEAVEVPLPALATQRETYDAAAGQFAALRRQAGFEGVPAFIEFSRDGRWEDLLPGTMVALARARLGAKIRCGGLDAQAFPSPREVAAFIAAAAQARVPFKATAGLHHPVRHRDSESGFVMHGFLNLLAAALLAQADAPHAQIEAAIADEDPRNFAFEEEELRWRDRRFDSTAIRSSRSNGFVAYGSCSFAEPVQDLIALGVLEA